MSTIRSRAKLEALPALLGSLALLILAWASGHRIETSQLNIVSSDSLYIPLLYEGSILSFRTSSASNLFPDWAYYAASHAIGLKPIDALLMAGILQCSITTMLLARFSGLAAALAYNVLYFAFGFPYYFSISFHHGLIAMTLLYLAGPNLTFRRGMALIFTVADPLFGLVSALFLLARACLERKFDAVEACLTILGLCGAFYLCESNVDVAKFTILLGGCLLAGWMVTLPSAAAIMRRLRAVVRAGPFGRLQLSAGEYRLCSAFLLCAALGSVVSGRPARYALPVLVASLIFYTWRTAEGKPSCNRGWIAATLLGTTSFTALFTLVLPLLAVSSRTALAQFECLADQLRSMQIDVVATDFWTFKPLYFIQGGNSGVHLLQMDFRDGTPDTRINDHRFVRGQAHFIVRNYLLCGSRSHETRSWSAHCSDEWYARLGVKARTEVCNGLEIIETDKPIDFSRWVGVFGSKGSAFEYNFRRNVMTFFKPALFQ